MTAEEQIAQLKAELAAQRAQNAMLQAELACLLSSRCATRGTAYGQNRPPLPLPTIQQLMGHADITTTTMYTKVSADDLARMMSSSEFD